MSIDFIAHSASEARHRLTAGSFHPDLLICDIHMPDMDGAAFIEKIRASSKLKSIKAIATTTGMIPGQSETAGGDGYDGYLLKPIIRSELFSVVKAVLGDGHEKCDQINRIAA